MLRSLTSPGWALWNICVPNDHGYASLVVDIIRFFLHTWLITRFVERAMWQVSHFDHELLILPGHPSLCCSIFVFYGVFCGRLFFLLLILFCLYSGCSLIESLWLPNSIFLIFLIVICICFILWSHDTLRLGNIDILVNSIYKGHH
jgi:hypothetical protein